MRLRTVFFIPGFRASLVQPFLGLRPSSTAWPTQAGTAGESQIVFFMNTRAHHAAPLVCTEMVQEHFPYVDFRLSSAFFLTLATFISAWGKAYKYFSLRAVYVLAIVIFEIGSLVCALSPSSASLIIGRAIQGTGAAGLAGGGYTIAAFVVPVHVQPIVIGLMGSVFTIASVAGPLLGGVLTSDVTWRWCFYINLPVGAVTIVCMLLFFRTPAHAKTCHNAPLREILMNFDPVGLVLMFSGVLCFFLAVQWGDVAKPWNSGEEIGLLVGCVVLLALFVLNEWYQGDCALIVFRILRLRSIGACSGFIFL